MPHRARRLLPALGLAAATLLAITSCTAGGEAVGTDGGSAQGGDGSATSDVPVAMATTTQLGSVLADITACAGTSSTTMMGPGDDPHDFSPSSQQIAEMTRAELVVVNGLGLESGMRTALENAEADGARLLEVAPGLDPLPYAAESTDAHAGEAEDAHAGEAEDDGQGHGDEDPHVWMDVSRMATAAEVIGDELAEVAGDEAYAECGRQAASALQDTDAQVREILSGVPGDRRTLVTDHAAYAYFADAYDFEVAGVVVPGGSTDAEPSSERLAQLVAQMDQEGADALVMSAGSGNRLIPALSAETGGEVPVVEIFEGGVGSEGSGSEAYAEAMLSNARALAEALG